MDKRIFEKPKTGMFAAVWMSLRVSLAARPGWWLASAGIMVLGGVMFAVGPIISAALFNAVLSLDSGSFAATLWLLIFFCGMTLIEQAYGLFNWPIIGHAARLTKLKIDTMLQNKVSQWPAVWFEDTDRLEKLKKAEAGAGQATETVEGVMNILLMFIPYFIISATWLYRLTPMLVWAVLVAFIPTLLSQFFRAKIYSKWRDQFTVMERRNDFFHNSIAGNHSEMRLLGAYTYLARNYIATLRAIQRFDMKNRGKIAILDLMLAVVSLCGYGGVIVLCVQAMMAGRVTPGEFAAVYGAVGGLFHMAENLVRYQIGNMAEGFSASQHWVDVLREPTGQGGEKRPERAELVCHGVSFIYPGSENQALHDVNLTLPFGTTVALVGENGSGKSTLMRLLTGLYDPTAGQVTVGGMDMKEIAAAGRFDGVSAVFQNHQAYPMTLRENLHASNMLVAFDENAAQEAMKQAGVHSPSPSMPDGLDTMLSREFGGVQLSGGQWQRVAIARGLYRPHEMIILDEPTSAIDPLEENRILRQFVDMTQNKTAIIATHRLALAPIADWIYVLRKGQICEQGKHDDLLAQDGEYARMFNAQAGLYE